MVRRRHVLVGVVPKVVPTARHEDAAGMARPVKKARLMRKVRLHESGKRPSEGVRKARIRSNPVGFGVACPRLYLFSVPCRP